MMTGEEYKASLNDGRETFFEGERIDDLPGHDILGITVESAAAGYDRFYDPAPGAVKTDDLVVLAPDVDDRDGSGEVMETPRAVTGKLGTGIVGELDVAPPVSGGHGAADLADLGSSLFKGLFKTGARGCRVVDPRASDRAAADRPIIVQKNQLGGGRSDVDAAEERIVH